MSADEASLSPDDPLALVAEVEALQDTPAALAEEVISQRKRQVSDLTGAAGGGGLGETSGPGG